MTKEISKNNNEIEEIKNKLSNIHGGIKEGDFVIDTYSSIHKVGQIGIKNNYGELCVELLSNSYNDKNEWSHYGTIEIKEFEDGKYIKLDIKDILEFEDYEKKLLQEAINFEKEEVDVEKVEERALAIMNKDFLVHQKNEVEKTKQKFQILERIMNRKRCELQSYVSEMSEKIEKMYKIIGQIELYLGIHEDIMQIQDGKFADINEPICLKQQILYMDEETGARLEENGLDYNSIEDFDEWLLQDKNYKKLLPEQKGIVIVRVRRYDKDYQSNCNLTEFFANIENKRTYILIRNGEKIYRIWAGITIKDRLFPSKKEMEILFNEESDPWKEKESMIFNYRQNLLMLQGLIDRTDILKPLPIKVNLFKPDTYGNFVKFIRDDEPSLTDGRLSYEDWKKELNSKIERGTRIFFCGFNWHDTKTYRDHETFPSHRYPHHVYNDPKRGIYNIKRIENHRYHGEDYKLVCNFNPNDEVWNKNNWDEHKRKKSIPFYLYRDDWCVLNYDLITIDDIDYYINNRYDRRNYLEMLPILHGIKKQRLKELEWEKGFVDNLKVKLKCDEKIIWETIDWWKKKVIWKRPIMEDDSKALRMIESKVKKLVS